MTFVFKRPLLNALVFLFSEVFRIYPQNFAKQRSSVPDQLRNTHGPLVERQFLAHLQPSTTLTKEKPIVLNVLNLKETTIRTLVWLKTQFEVNFI